MTCAFKYENEVEGKCNKECALLIGNFSSFNMIARMFSGIEQKFDSIERQLSDIGGRISSLRL